MNISVITILLVFTTIVLFGTSSAKISFCDLTRDQTQHIEIISIFNIGKDLILQVIDRSISPSKPQYDFWRVYGTDQRPVNVLGNMDDIDDEGSIDYGIRDKIYKISNFIQSIDEINEFSHTIKTNSTISATNVAEHHIDVMANKCDPPAGEDIPSWCITFDLVRGAFKLICLYDQEYGQGLIAFYMPPEGENPDQDAKHVFVGPKNFKNIQDFPEDNPCKEHKNSVSFMLSSKIEEEEINQVHMSVLKQTFNTFAIYVNDYKNDEFSEIVNSSEIYHLFQFNHYYDVMSCPKKCTFNTPLFKIRYDRNGRDGHKIIAEPTDLTLIRMLGCQQKPIPFNPFYFCLEDRKFESILTFGTDFYFQHSGGFWRYNSHGFNRDEDKWGPKIGSIRLDSDMTAILEKKGIDTSYKVMGFAFNEGHFDICPPEDNSCVKKLKESKVYYQVCMIGVTNEPQNPTDLKRQMGVDFIYTPSELKSPTNMSDSCNRFALDFNKHGQDYFRRTTGLYDANDPKGIPELKSIYYKRPLTEPEKNRGPLILAIFHYSFTKLLYVTYGIVKSVDTNGYPEVDNSFIGNHRIFNLESTGEGSSVFSFNNNTYFHELDLYYLFVDVRMNIRSIEIREAPYKGPNPFYKMFKCPFKSSTSLVTVQREMACLHNKTSLAQSVFGIGKYIYYQLGQHFYKFNEFKKFYFSYDKYITDLFNDYFDTRHRVTGVSIPNAFPNGFVVIIQGKSGHNYQHIGQYIYAVFTIDDREKYPLSAYKGIPLKFKLGRVFGVGGYKGADYLVDSIAFWEDRVYHEHSTLFWFSYYNFTDTSVTPELNLWMYYTQDSNRFGFMFEDSFSLQNWSKTNLGVKGSDELHPFDQVNGAHELSTYFHNKFDNEILSGDPLLIYGRKFGEPLKVYKIDIIISKIANQPPFLIDYKGFWNQDGFHITFCPDNHAQSSHSSDIGLKRVNYILAVLIIIVLSLVLVIAFYSYRRNQRQITQKIKAIQTTNTSHKLQNNSGAKSTENQSVGQQSNQTERKAKQTSDMSSKGSDSLSTRSQ